MPFHPAVVPLHPDSWPASRAPVPTAPGPGRLGPGHARARPAATARSPAGPDDAARRRRGRGRPSLRRKLEPWSHRYAQAAVEIVGGDRPVSQLLRWPPATVYADLHRRALLVARAGGHQPGQGRVQPVRPKVVSVHTCFVSDTAVEAGIRVRYGARSRALAARFELAARDRWVCTAPGLRLSAVSLAGGAGRQARSGHPDGRGTSCTSCPSRTGTARCGRPWRTGRRPW